MININVSIVMLNVSMCILKGSLNMVRVIKYMDTGYQDIVTGPHDIC
jgi:hypothetical protein